jgi:hypothetical protein
MTATRIASAALLVLGACARTPTPRAEPIAGDRLLAPAGEAGETVWVLLTPVRGDRREQFERLMEHLWRVGLDFGERQDSVVLRTFRRTRMLRPTQPNPDGTYTYVFLPDPRISGAEYGLEPLLKRMLPPDSARALQAAFDSSLAGAQQQVLTVQALPHP